MLYEKQIKDLRETITGLRSRNAHQVQELKLLEQERNDACRRVEALERLVDTSTVLSNIPAPVLRDEKALELIEIGLRAMRGLGEVPPARTPTTLSPYGCTCESWMEHHEEFLTLVPEKVTNCQFCGKPLRQRYNFGRNHGMTPEQWKPFTDLDETATIDEEGIIITRLDIDTVQDLLEKHWLADRVRG